MIKFPVLLIALSFGVFLNPALAKNYQNQRYNNTKETTVVDQNDSYRGEMSQKTNRPKNTYVHSYDRKNGTHVPSHYRSKKNK